MRTGFQKILLFFVFLIIVNSPVISQKKPLDHSVYDSWQSIGERMISNDGKWVVYTIDPQEGDNELMIQSPGTGYKKIIPRGYNAVITEDSRFVVFKIKPLYKDSREAKIKKKKAEEFPKDSIGIVELGKEDIWKKSGIRTYKTPQKSFGWVAYHMDKLAQATSKSKSAETGLNKRTTDSLNRVIDSLKKVIETIPGQKQKKNKNKNKDEVEIEIEMENEVGEYDDIFTAQSDDDSTDAGTDLVLRNLSSGEEKVFSNILDYYFSKNGEKLLLKKAKNSKDNLSLLSVLLYLSKTDRAITLSRGGNEFKNFAFSDDGSQLAYVAERDTAKNVPKLYRIWYYRDGMDSSALLADKNSVGMRIGMTVSEFGTVSFSKSGRRLFFGVAPIQPLKDTSIIDIDMPKLDIWHYNDDYLQTVQTFPNRLRIDQQQSFLAVYDLEKRIIKQLGSKEIPQVLQTYEGDGDQFVGVTDFGKRIESQWQGNTMKDIYSIDVTTGNKKLVKENLFGQVYPSSTGKYILWYDRKARNYFAWDGKTTRNLTSKIKYPLWNEDSQVPEDANPYGVMGWLENDAAAFIYDRYDIWAIDPSGENAALNFWGGMGRKTKTSYRYIQLDTEKRFFGFDDNILLRSLNETTKASGLAVAGMDPARFYPITIFFKENVLINQVRGANKEIDTLIFTMENFVTPPDLYVATLASRVKPSDITFPEMILEPTKLSTLNPQQSNYLWGTAELFKWKAYDGKEATGIVYKPENFDPKKKYPMICYFYEKLSQNLNNYYAPAPIRSAINIPFFVSSGYVIFLPDIHYKIGQPGKDAYNYIVSGTRALVKKGFVDSTRIGIQGHSWGGYEVAYLITQTKLFKAAWAGAPVANMTSAYGGIRWESGVSRQFQYERTQSRIGASLWDKPQLYIQNSPLFHLKNVTTPLVIMANDADGAVPWYQGIELFSGLRRLGKKVWMFNYNGQGHGLTQRQDMKDYQIRMQQFFDWILKGEKPAKWIIEGVPAVNKGKDWGLEIVE
jgi:dienelactone hydrolase